MYSPGMVCRHRPGDPDCSSNRPIPRPDPPKTPDAENYTIEEVERIGKHLVMKVQYPNCRSCAYEGSKVLVFLNASESEALRWRRIDPHFRDPKQKTAPRAAPSPAARFPASPEGWADALTYARGKA